eukprot:6181561-Pleurochrysis_carterae.AAC.1
MEGRTRTEWLQQGMQNFRIQNSGISGERVAGDRSKDAGKHVEMPSGQKSRAHRLFLESHPQLVAPIASRIGDGCTAPPPRAFSSKDLRAPRVSTALPPIRPQSMMMATTSSTTFCRSPRLRSAPPRTQSAATPRHALWRHLSIYKGVATALLATPSSIAWALLQDRPGATEVTSGCRLRIADEPTAFDEIGAKAKWKTRETEAWITD